MHAPWFVAAAAALVSVLPSQQFSPGATYLMSPIHPLPPNQIYAGIRRVDPFTGQTQPFVQFTSNFHSNCSVAYDPFRDRIVALCVFGASPNVQIHAFDGTGNSTVLSSTALHHLAPRGDGKVYGCKPGSGNPVRQQVFYLDVANQEQTLMDVGGAAPWEIYGGGTLNSVHPIQAMIYEPSENALFLALNGDPSVPSCGGVQGYDVHVRKLPLNASGTALSGPVLCASYDVAGVANIYETPVGFSYGPNGKLVLAVYGNTSGAMPRLLYVDPVTAQMSPFATVGPYTGDVAFSAGAYNPLTGRCLVLDAGNDRFRSFGPGEAGAGAPLAPYGPAGLGGARDTLFVVGPIGPGATLSGTPLQLSVTTGGVQNLHFDPGPAFANDLYLIVGSFSGWSPGMQLGSVVLPINFDSYSALTLQLANSPFFVNTAGVLPASGEISAQIALPPGALLGLAGLTLYHAAVAADNSTTFTHASNPVPLLLLP